MSVDNAVSNRRPAKRSRITAACQSCRSRKLSCNGGRPCTRCQQEDRECVDAYLEERTPLTRKRMSELENSLNEYDCVWTALYPQMAWSNVSSLLKSVGLDATVQAIRKHNGIVEATEPRASPADNEILTSTDQDDSRILQENLYDRTTYPPTRLPSPQTVPIRVAFDLHGTPRDFANAWNEEHTPANRSSGPPTGDDEAVGTTASNDFGTGMRAGVGYIGLSSAVTLLRAIQKLAPADIHKANHQPETRSATSPSPTRGGQSRLLVPSALQGDGRPEILTLPPPHEIRPLVDSYFQYFHLLTPIVHEPTIRAQITGALPLPTGRESRVLFNMIFATGAFDLATDDAFDSNGLEYYEKARTALHEDLLEGGSLMLVQGLAIMAIWLQRCNRPNAGYVCLGLAIRMATALGVHVPVTNDKSDGPSVLEREMRNRIWWCLVTLEGGQSLTYGRPRAISLPSLAAVRLPINIDDGLLTVSTKQTPPDSQHVTIYTALASQARLAQMVFESLDRVSRSLPHPSPEQIKWCGDNFRNRLRALPSYMQPGASGPYEFARAVQVWRARDYQSILYRPVLLSVAFHTGDSSTSDVTTQQIINICRDLALDNLRDILDFSRTTSDPHRGCEWYTLYFGIQASLTLLLSVVSEPHHPLAATWRERIQETIFWMRQLGSMKELGESCAQVMENIVSSTANSATPAPPNMIPPITDTGQHNEQSMHDIEGFDFEHYLTEIWNGDEQFASMANDMNLSMLQNLWDDVAIGS